MERLKVGDEVASLVLEVSPEDLRDIANKLEARAKASSNGQTIVLPISNSISLLYNVPVQDRTAPFIGKRSTLEFNTNIQ